MTLQSWAAIMGGGVGGVRTPGSIATGEPPYSLKFWHLAYKSSRVDVSNKVCEALWNSSRLKTSGLMHGRFFRQQNMCTVYN